MSGVWEKEFQSVQLDVSQGKWGSLDENEIRPSFKNPFSKSEKPFSPAFVEWKSEDEQRDRRTRKG